MSATTCHFMSASTMAIKGMALPRGAGQAAIGRVAAGAPSAPLVTAAAVRPIWTTRTAGQGSASARGPGEAAGGVLAAWGRYQPPHPRAMPAGRAGVGVGASSAARADLVDKGGDEEPGSTSGPMCGPTALVALASRAVGTFFRQVSGVQLAMMVCGAQLAASMTFPAPASASAVGVKAGATSVAHVMASAWSGLLAGILHTLTGPDHLAALAPLTIGRSRLHATLLGGLWGCGHNTGQVVFGLLFLLLRDTLPFGMDVISQWGQAIVGVTLVTIGYIGAREAGEMGSPAELRAVGAAVDPAVTQRMSEEDNRVSIGTFFTGLIHGLQPDALLIIIPAFAMHKIAAAAFLGTFLSGTVLAMAAYTAFIGEGSRAISRKAPWMTQRISLVSAAVAVAVGIALIVSAATGVDIL